MTSEDMSIAALQRQLLSVEKLRGRVRRILRCVINLHIDILVLESRVTQLIDDCREMNGDLLEVQRLDTLISTLRDYNGPTVCHEWPYPLIFKGTIDAADVAQILNPHVTEKASSLTQQQQQSGNPNVASNFTSNISSHLSNTFRQFRMSHSQNSAKSHPTVLTPVVESLASSHGVNPGAEGSDSDCSSGVIAAEEG